MIPNGNQRRLLRYKWPCNFVFLVLMILALAPVGYADVVVTAVPRLQQVELAYPWNGRVNDLAIDPADDRHLILASDSGGIFQSVDGGGSWSHVDGFPEFKVQRVMWGPERDGQTRYIPLYATVREPTVQKVNATDELGQRVLHTTTGVWESLDGGTTWKAIVRQGSFGSPFAGCPDEMGAHGIAKSRTGGHVAIATDCGVIIIPNFHSSVHFVLPTGSASAFHAVAYAENNSLIARSADENIVWMGNGSDPARPTWVSANLGTIDGQIAKYGAGGQHLLLTVGPLSFTMQMSDPQGEGNFASKIFVTSDFGLNWSEVLDAGKSYSSGCGGLPGIFSGNTAGSQRGANGIFPQFLHIIQSDTCGLFQRQCFPTRSRGYGICLADWQDSQLNLSHGDTRFFRISSAGAVYIGTDGGLHVGSAIDPDRLSNQMYSTENTGRGLNALQVYSVTGRLPSPNVELSQYELFFGTQDNDFGASADGGASWPGRVGTEGPVVPLDGSLRNSPGILAFRCNAGNFDPCIFKMGPLYQSDDRWFGPGTDTPGSLTTHPIQIGSSTLLQGVKSQGDTSGTEFWLSRDNNRSWNKTSAKTRNLHHGNIRTFAGQGQPTVADIYAFRPIDSGCDFNYPYTLDRITLQLGNLPADVVSRTLSNDCSDTGQTGKPKLVLFGGVFDWHGVFDVDPSDQNHLMVVDKDGKIFETHDSGTEWRRRTDVESAITQAGQFGLMAGGQAQVRLISFAPDNPDIVIIGTQGRGIFVSADNGRSFSSPFATAVPMISGIHWLSGNRAILASYGRGLWWLDLSLESLQVPELSDFIGEACEGSGSQCVFDMITQAFVPAPDTGMPGPSDGMDGRSAEIAFAQRGAIQSFGYDSSEGRLLVNGRAGSSLKTYASRRGAIAAGTDITIAKSAAESYPQLAKLLSDGLEVGAIIAVKGEIRYVLLRPAGAADGPRELPPVKDTPISTTRPQLISINVVANRYASGLPAYMSGESVKLSVESSEPTGEFELYLDGVNTNQSIQLANGKALQTTVSAPSGHGLHRVEIRNPKGMGAAILSSQSFVVTHLEQEAEMEQCANGMELVGEKCSCPRGTLFDTGANDCTPEQKCEGNLAWNGEKCVCPPGTLFDSATKFCASEQKCESNLAWDGEKCSCPKDAPFWDIEKQNCVSILGAACENGMVFENDKCVCPTGMVYDELSKKCGFEEKCEGGMVLDAGKCACPKGYYFDEAQKACAQFQ
jgi:hypothetical protein